jgi:16S rRNA (guanine527-N7)-methyltransferase
MDDPDRQLLLAGARSFGLELGPAEFNRFDQYLALIQKWAGKVSLTALRGDREIVLKHFLDSLAVHPLLSDQLFVMDLGAGVGCPGIPLKIVRPSLRLLLLESKSKKVSFLNQAIRTLELADTSAIQQRAESTLFQEGLKGQVDVVLARAVGKLDWLIRLSAPYLKRDGRLIAMKGPDPEPEIREAGPILEALRGRVLEVRRYELPETGGSRSLVVVECFT